MSGRGPGLVLGIDTQPTRLGLALVRLDERPVWANTYPLTSRGMGPSVRAAMGEVAKAVGRVDGDDGAAGVVLIGIERGIVRGSSLDVLYDCGAAYGVARDAAERRFRETALHVDDRIRPSAVKGALLGPGKGNAPKAELTVWARHYALAHGWNEVQMNGLAMNDATDALGIAVFVARRRAG